MLTCLEEKIAVGDLPVVKDIPLPPPPEGVVLDGTGKLKVPTRRDDEEEEDFKERRKAHNAYKWLVDRVRWQWSDRGFALCFGAWCPVEAKPRSC